MKIKQILDQHRRDFRAVFVCEGCGHEETMSGYDDTNFHVNVIPRFKCEKCGKTSAECGVEYRPLSTKYPDGYQV